MALLLNANDSVNRSYTITKPSPNHTLTVNGVGERTENLVPPDLTRNYMALQGVTDGITYCVASSGGALYVIPASNSETYTIKVHTGDETLPILRCGFIDIATPTVGRQITQAKEIVNAKNPSLTTTNSANKPYFIFQISGSYATEHGLANVMLNSGSTPKPYEPYGYFIEIEVS